MNTTEHHNSGLDSLVSLILGDIRNQESVQKMTSQEREKELAQDLNRWQ